MTSPNLTKMSSLCRPELFTVLFESPGQAIRRGKRMATEKEAALFEEKLPDLVKQHAGKFALIHGQNIEIFGQYNEAVRAGYARYGLAPFLVKEIRAPVQESFNS